MGAPTCTPSRWGCSRTSRASSTRGRARSSPTTTGAPMAPERCAPSGARVPGVTSEGSRAAWPTDKGDTMTTEPTETERQLRHNVESVRDELLAVERLATWYDEHVGDSAEDVAREMAEYFAGDEVTDED